MATIHKKILTFYLHGEQRRVEMNGDAGFYYKIDGVLRLGLRDYRHRTLQSFADFVLADNKNRGRKYRVGKISKYVLNDMKRQGIKLESKEVVIFDETVRKYVTHPKRLKGAAINLRKMVKAERAVKHPKNVYQDMMEENKLAYICTRGYSPKKCVKVVIDVNYHYKGKVMNKIVSIGIIDPKKMDVLDRNGNRRYRKIK